MTVLLAAHYVLAVTVAALFHGPGHAGGGPNGACCAVAVATTEQSCCDHDDSHDTKSPRENTPDHGPRHGQKCPVCQFLSQKPIPAESVREVTSAALPEELAAVAPLASESHNPAPWHSRAPPAVA